MEAARLRDERDMETLPLTHSDARPSSSSSSYRPTRLLETIAWGCVAECAISVCCPLVMSGSVDATAAALNLLCPLLGGMASALDEASSSSPMRRHVATFQTGFVGVATSFPFMAEQASLLGGSLRGCAYIFCTLVGACLSFAVGRVLFTVLLRIRRLRRALVVPRGGDGAASRQLLRIIGLVVTLAWLWVLFTPAGAVFDPLAIRNAKMAKAAAAAADAAAAPTAAGDDPSPPPPLLRGASKYADCQHLASGLLMQAVGLIASSAITARANRRQEAAAAKGEEAAATTLLLGPLQCNALACFLLLLLRLVEALDGIGDEALLVTKVTTSFCGALSVSGMLAAFVVGHEALHGRRGVLNLCGHAALGMLAMLMLTIVQAWDRSGYL